MYRRQYRLVSCISAHYATGSLRRTLVIFVRICAVMWMNCTSAKEDTAAPCAKLLSLTQWTCSVTLKQLREVIVVSISFMRRLAGATILLPDRELICPKETLSRTVL